MSRSGLHFDVATCMGAASMGTLQTLDDFLAEATTACSKLVPCQRASSSGGISAIAGAQTPSACSHHATQKASMLEVPELGVIKCALTNTDVSGKTSSLSCENDHEWIVVGDVSS